MRRRLGFVSNSSSTCYILDLREPEVKNLLDKILVGSPYGLSRNTAKMIGEDAVYFANELKEEAICNQEVAEWMLNWANKLGIENFVFIRESDEGIGGYLFEDQEDSKLIRKLEELSLSMMDYH